MKMCSLSRVVFTFMGFICDRGNRGTDTSKHGLICLQHIDQNTSQSFNHNTHTHTHTPTHTHTQTHTGSKPPYCNTHTHTGYKPPYCNTHTHIHTHTQRRSHE